jgi:ubiquinol-cytochrome c reductase cytochrome b subunit
MSTSAPIIPPRSRRFWNWLEHRTGLNSLLRQALDEPIPGGARWAYIFGSGLLFLFLSQFITGVFLVLYYVPEADEAHVTVAYIVKAVAAGSFLRSVHAYGSSAVMIVLLLHLSQVFTFGSYKGRRELLWLAGCVLLLLMAGMAFTGYLLPWDQKAYYATVVGTNLISEIPLIGPGLTRLVRGGTQMGTLTLSRFFVIHVFFLPVLIFLFIVLHIYLFRKAGAAGPTYAPPLAPNLPTEPFYPRQLRFDVLFTIAVIVTLGLTSYFRPMDLGPVANPAVTQYLPRPEWYYRPMFEELKYFPGSLEAIGILVVPGVVLALLFLLPFLDRSPERRPWRRPVAVGAYFAVLLGLVGLGALSYWQDARNPIVAQQLRTQNREMAAYMRAPFKPYLVGAVPPHPAAPATPLVTQGRTIFTGQGCNSCHGDHGEGTAIAVALTDVGSKFPPDRMAEIIRHPTPAMTAGGMPSFNLSDGQLKALVAYLDSLK